MKLDLELIEIPGAADAERRAAVVVAAAFAEVEPSRPDPRRARRPLIAIAVCLVVIAGVLSPPGRAVVNHVRRAVGIDHAAPALFSLPGSGRLLVASDSGIWVARPDGSRRLLGRYDEASWSPFGRFVVASRANELATLEPDGTVRWTLARPRVRFPRWTGSAVDTRIAYFSGDRLHVVAGDGTGDFDVGGPPAAARVAPAWQADFGFPLAYAASDGRVSSYLTGKTFELWRSVPLRPPRSLEWSGDGKELLVLSAGKVSRLRAKDGHVLSEHATPGTAAAAYRPGTHAVADLRRTGDLSEIRLDGRVLFSFAGKLQGLIWSPDGRWVLTGSPDADQWMFVRADGRKIVAASNISAQFGSQAFPRVEGWCCSE